MLKSDKYKFIFIAIPKTGTRSIIDLCKKRFNAEIDFKNSHSRIAPSNYNDYYKFTVVRNPYDRVVSMWKSTTQRNNGDRYGFKSIMDSENSFKSFCRKILKTKNLIVQPQNYWLSKNTFNQILRFENLNEDWNSLPFNIENFKLPHINKTNHNHYSEYYDKETIQIVQEKYAEDIEFFGYEF